MLALNHLRRVNQSIESPEKQNLSVTDHNARRRITKKRSDITYQSAGDCSSEKRLDSRSERQMNSTSEGHDDLLAKQLKRKTQFSAHELITEENGDLLAQQLKRQTSCSAHKLIPDYLVKRGKKQKMRAERTEALDREDLIKKLAVENAKLRRMAVIGDQSDDDSDDDDVIE
eukprot:10462178-Ditylum_brightwellii.AAC.1